MKIRVGHIPYLNLQPYYYGMDRREDVELYSLVPSELTQAAEQGMIDAGPMPLVDYFRLEEEFVPLGYFCISTLRKSGSVLLFSRRPMEELSGLKIAVTDESSTSRRLLEVILTYKFNVRPEGYVGLSEPNDAFLLIGDNALRNRRGMPGYTYRYDLAEEWFKWTQLPFVYALWIIRRDLGDEVKRYMESLLFTTLEEGTDHVSQIVDIRRHDLGISLKSATEYMRGFRYWCGLEELKSIEHFRRLLEAEV